MLGSTIYRGHGALLLYNYMSEPMLPCWEAPYIGGMVPGGRGALCQPNTVLSQIQEQPTNMPAHNQ